MYITIFHGRFNVRVAPLCHTNDGSFHASRLTTMKRHQQTIQSTFPGIGRIIHRFIPQIRKQGLLLFFSFVALLAETMFRLLEPWPLKFMFDRIILTGFELEPTNIPAIDELSPVALLTVLALALVAISSLRGISSYFSTATMALAASRVLTEVRSQLYSHLQRLSLGFHYQAKNGDLIARVTSDIGQMREVTVSAVLPLIVNILTMLGMVGVMFWLNIELALIAVSVFPLFILASNRITKRIQNVARSSRKREGAMAATVAEAMGAIKVVKALSLQGMLEKSFHRHNKKSLTEGAKAQKLRAGLERTVEMLVAVVTALVLWRGVQLVLQKVITPGDLLIFITYLKLAFKPMRQVAKYMGQIAKATASGERIIDLLEIVPEIQDNRGAITAHPFWGTVEFKNVTFGYKANKCILQNLSFKVEPGQKVALVGPSGGG